jgi:hypothetical protein
MEGMNKKVILSAQVPTVQRDRLAHLAAAHERSLRGEVRRALDTYLRLAEPPEDFSSTGRASSAPERGQRGSSPVKAGS